MVNSYNNWNVRLALVGKKSKDILTELANRGERVIPSRFSQWKSKLVSPPPHIEKMIEDIIMGWERGSHGQAK